jgi:hypothetical protein
MWHCEDQGIRFHRSVDKILSRYMVHIPENNIGYSPAMTTQWVSTENSLMIFEEFGTSAVQEFSYVSLSDHEWNG